MCGGHHGGEAGSPHPISLYAAFSTSDTRKPRPLISTQRIADRDREFSLSSRSWNARRSVCQNIAPKDISAAVRQCRAGPLMLINTGP